MSKKIICEKCGSEMESFIKGSSCVTECRICGWGWATTYQEPIKLDDTDYNLCIKPVEKPSANTLRCVSQLLACNFLEAKKKLQSEIVITDKAISVRNIATQLNKNKIVFIITPTFPYEL